MASLRIIVWFCMYIPITYASLCDSYARCKVLACAFLSRIVLIFFSFFFKNDRSLCLNIRYCTHDRIFSSLICSHVVRRSPIIADKNISPLPHARQTPPHIVPPPPTALRTLKVTKSAHTRARWHMTAKLATISRELYRALPARGLHFGPIYQSAKVPKVHASFLLVDSVALLYLLRTERGKVSDGVRLVEVNRREALDDGLVSSHPRRSRRGHSHGSHLDAGSTPPTITHFTHSQTNTRKIRQSGVQSPLSAPLPGIR